MGVPIGFPIGFPKAPMPMAPMLGMPKEALDSGVRQNVVCLERGITI
jgi:hypothetical protein